MTANASVAGRREDCGWTLERLRGLDGQARAAFHGKMLAPCSATDILAELNREVDTLASRSQDAALTSTALAPRSLTDRMREQARNVE